MKFSTKYSTKIEFRLRDNNKCCSKISGYHAYILEDCDAVFEGIHLWRIQVINHAKGWISFQVSEKKEFDVHSFNKKSVYGISNKNQFYNDGVYCGEDNNKINTHHFRVEKCEIDMLLNCDKGTLNLYVVDENNNDKNGEIIKEKEAKLWNLDIKKYNGFVPHFNVFGGNTQLRIAKIPHEMYNKSYTNINIFESVDK